MITRVWLILRPVIVFVVAIMAISIVVGQIGLIGPLELAIIGVASAAIAWLVERAFRRRSQARTSRIQLDR